MNGKQVLHTVYQRLNALLCSQNQTFYGVIIPCISELVEVMPETNWLLTVISVLLCVLLLLWLLRCSSHISGE